MRFDHCRDLFMGELSINQAILDNIYLGTEITGDLCGVFNKKIKKIKNKPYLQSMTGCRTETTVN